MGAAHSITRWVCSECSFDPEKLEDVTFPTESECQRHMLDNHNASFDLDDLPLLLTLSQRTMVEPSSCPLCLNDRNLVDVASDERVAGHLHSFALRALPWDFDLDEAAASAGSSDSSSPNYQPVVKSVDEEREVPFSQEALDSAIHDLHGAVEAFEEIQAAEKLTAVFGSLNPSSTFWGAIPNVEASQREKCCLVIMRVVDNFRRLLISELGFDHLEAQDLRINIQLDMEALQNCLLPKSRHDSDLWQEALDTLSAEANKELEEMAEDEHDYVSEQIEKLLMLARHIQSKCKRVSLGFYGRYADHVVKSCQLIGNDESIFLGPEKTLPWAAILVIMKVYLPSTVASLTTEQILETGLEVKPGSTADIGPKMVTLLLQQLHLLLRAINRGRVYGLVYTIENTAEEALADLRLLPSRFTQLAWKSWLNSRGWLQNSVPFAFMPPGPRQSTGSAPCQTGWKRRLGATVQA